MNLCTRHPLCLPARRSLRYAAGLLALLAVLLPAAFAAPAPAIHASQSDVEAAYLYNFGKFVHWPNQKQLQAMNICILGHDPFGASLDRIVAGERIDGLPLAVIRLKGPAEIKSCAMLFIDRSEAPHLAQDLAALDDAPVMTVSDMPGFVEHGGMIQFVLEEDRIRFKVNLAAADKSGLILSSQLLKVAVSVVGAPKTRAAK